MKETTVKEFKRHLAHFTDLATKGETILVSRYNKPYVIIRGAGSENLVVGKNVGKRINPLELKLASKNAYLKALDEDRE